MIDTIHIVISDTHSGSNHALFIGRNWQGIQNTHYPTSAQIEIRKHLLRYAAEVAHARKGKRIRLVVNGDAIDGDHHNSGDVCTINEKEQSDIHIEIMIEFQKLIKWQRGDELYYTKGTQSHVHHQEDYIGEQMGAVANGDYYSWDFLKLETNGVLSWFVHHGAGAGHGANEGNNVRNWLKNICYDALKDGERQPDIVYTGHTHDPTYSTFISRNGMKFYTMHGIGLPSWQAKTTYAWMKAPVQRNKIGGVIHEIKADGVICIPRFCIMGYE